jgi:hypothetical protein
MNPAIHGQTQKNDVGKTDAAMEDCACHPVATVIRIVPLAAGTAASARRLNHSTRLVIKLSSVWCVFGNAGPVIAIGRQSFNVDLCYPVTVFQ